MNYADLKSEIQTDPKSLGIAAQNGNAIGIAGLLNKKQYTIQQPVLMTNVLIWMGQNGLTPTIQGLAGTSSSQLQNAAATFLLAVQGSMGTLDVTNPVIDAMIQAFVTASIFTQAVKNALYAMNQYSGSRVEVLFGVGSVVTADDVLTALRQ